MAWATMHFAVGMGSAGAAACVGCLIMRRGWRWLPVTMTVGGVWAMIPDIPRIFREDFPNTPLAGLFGSKALEARLEQWGDLFFFHGMLDAQPREYALAGLAIILLLYNAALLLMMRLEHQQSISIANRAWRVHGLQGLTTPEKTYTRPDDEPPEGAEESTDRSSVIYRIDPNQVRRAE